MLGLHFTCLPGFGPFAAGVAQLTGHGEERQSIATAMHDAWAGFARSGDPGPDWPQWTDSNRATKVFNSAMTVEIDPRGAELDLW